MLFTILITITSFNLSGTSVTTAQIPFHGTSAQCQATAKQLTLNREVQYTLPSENVAAAIINQAAQCIQLSN